MDMEKAKKIICIAECFVIILFLFTFGSGAVVSPIFGDINMIDEGQFGAWVSHMLSGEHLYKDIYAAYGPFYIYPLYIFSKIFGPSVFLIRIVYIVLNTFLAVLIARAVLQKLTIRYGLELSTLFMLVIVPGFGMRQGIGLLSILLSFQAMEEKSYRWSIAAGISLATAFLVSSEIGIFTTTICGFFFFYKLVTAEKMNNVIKKLFFLLISIACIFLLVFVWANSEGWFSDYIYSTLDDLIIYSGINIPNGKDFPHALQLMPSTWSIIEWIKYIVSKEMLLYWLFFFYLTTFLYFFIRMILKISKKKDILIFLIALYGFFLSIILIGRNGHFPFTLSPVFILFAYFLESLLQTFKVSKKKYEKLISLTLISIICLFSFRIVLIYRPHFLKVLSIPHVFFEAKNSPKYVGFVAISPVQAKTIRTIQNFVEKNTKDTDTIFFFNNEPMMYLFVRRTNPTRYDLPEVANIKEKRLEVLNDLIKDQTKFIIDDTEAWSVDDISNRQRLPEVTRYIEGNYEKKFLDNFIIYIRKEN